jgi:predicted nucleotidyltransferase
VERLKKDNMVLGVMVFGSMISGDFWEESDIDMFVIVNKELNRIENVYTELYDIPIHMKLISKSDFMKLHRQNINKGHINRLIASCKFVFSKDSEITSKYDQGRYYTDTYREICNLKYLGRVLGYLSECRKYLSNDILHTSYCLAVKCVNDFSKLYANFNGYMVTRDVLTMYMDTNETFNKLINDLFFNKEDVRKSIENTLKFIDEEIDVSLKTITYLLLEYMKKQDRLLSAEDIKKEKIFSEFNVNIEYILNRLWEKKIIKKRSRTFYIDGEAGLFEENVYAI